MTDQQTGIITPEAVLLEFETAGTASRVLSALLDFSMQGVALGLVFAAMTFVAGAAGGAVAGGWVLATVLVFTVFLVLLGYPVAMEALWNGRTLGMAAVGLRVVTVEGAPVRFRHAAIRGAIGLLELWGLLGLPAMIATILSRRSQRLGDMVAGTVMLRERSGAQALAAMSFAPPPGYEAYAATLDVSAITEAQYGLVRSFLTRVMEFTPGARMTLAMRLANPIAVSLNHSPPPMVAPELFLVCIAAAYQRRHGGPAGSWSAAAPAYGAYGASGASGASGGYGGYGPPPVGSPSYGSQPWYSPPPTRPSAPLPPGYGPQPLG